MEKQLHQLLVAQVQKHFGTEQDLSGPFGSFLSEVADTYAHFIPSEAPTPVPCDEGNDFEDAVLREILGPLDVAIYVIDAKSLDILYVNPKGADLFGKPQDEMTGRRCTGYICPQLCGDCTLADTFRKGITVERVFTDSRGQNIPVLRTVARTSYGGRSVYVESVFDITDRKQTETELFEAKQKAELACKAKSEFMANMSHEIRTPLNGVIGFAEVLSKSNLDAGQKECVTTISRSANSLLGIIDDILDFTTIDAGRMELKPEPTDLIALCRQVAGMVQNQADEKNLEIRLELPDSFSGLVLADEIRLRQILLNLLVNAIKFTDSGFVRFCVEETDYGVNHSLNLRFTVQDTGIGIPETTQQRIFEAFIQQDLSHTKKYGGTGLGLSISNHLLHLMNSSLQLQSAPGEGSTFWFSVTFPNYEQQVVFQNPNTIYPFSQHSDPMEQTLKSDDTVAGQVSESESQNSAKPLTILIAEDNKVNMTLVKIVLKNRYPQVAIMEAINGSEAVQTYVKIRPNLVLMDVQMPVMSGYDATIRIREAEKEFGTHVPIIALTAGTMDEEKAECLKVGMDDFVSKPIINDNLFAVIDHWLNM